MFGVSTLLTNGSDGVCLLLLSVTCRGSVETSRATHSLQEDFKSQEKKSEERKRVLTSLTNADGKLMLQ